MSRAARKRRAKRKILRSKPRSVSAGIGPACPRCQRPTVRWVHSASFVPPDNRGHYTEWYECVARDCQTRLIMPPAFFVHHKTSTLDDVAAYEAHLRDIMGETQT